MNKSRLLIIFLLFLSLSSYSQSVTVGSSELGAGLGFGLFHVSTNDTAGATSLAASGVIQAHYQYAFKNELSVGLLLQRNGFLTEKDSGNTVRSYLAGASVLFRAVNGEKTVLYFGLSGGQSWMNLYHKASNRYVNGEGYFMDFMAGTRMFFSERIAMFIELSYNKQHFSNFDDNNGNLLMTGPVNSSRKFILDMGGMNLRTGLNIKFGGR